MFLAESVPAGAPGDPRPTSWEQIVPEQGKLFVVGDPKQSIYRFRRADVVQMVQLQRLLEGSGGSLVSLVQKFPVPGQPSELGQLHLFPMDGRGTGQQRWRNSPAGQIRGNVPAVGWVDRKFFPAPGMGSWQRGGGIKNRSGPRPGIQRHCCSALGDRWQPVAGTG